jgi:competence protein ComEC
VQRLKPNAVSCVLRVGNAPGPRVAGRRHEQAQEAALVARGADLAADLLLVPHHGSRTSSSEAFLDTVRPWAAVVQAGYRNRFGHPEPVVQQRYEQRGIVLALLRPAAVPPPGPSRTARVLRCERQAAPRYWRHEAAPGADNAPSAADAR